MSDEVLWAVHFFTCETIVILLDLNTQAKLALWEYLNEGTISPKSDPVYVFGGCEKCG